MCKDKEPCSMLYPFLGDDRMMDVTGCILEGRHNYSPHRYITENGEVIEWYDDLQCQCGCNDEPEGQSCVVYQTIEMSAKEFNYQYSVGRQFIYSPVLNSEKNQLRVVTMCKAWDIPTGNVVVLVTGVSGGVDVRHLMPCL